MNDRRTKQIWRPYVDLLLADEKLALWDAKVPVEVTSAESRCYGFNEVAEETGSGGSSLNSSLSSDRSSPTSVDTSDISISMNMSDSGKIFFLFDFREHESFDIQHRSHFSFMFSFPLSWFHH